MKFPRSSGPKLIWGSRWRPVGPPNSENGRPGVRTEVQGPGAAHLPESGPLLSDAESLGYVGVAARIHSTKVVEEAAALADKHQEPTAGTEIFGICLKVFGEVINTARQESHLHVRRTGVFFVPAEFLDALRLRGCCHTILQSKSNRDSRARNLGVSCGSCKATFAFR